MRTLTSAGAALLARMVAGEKIDMVPLVYMALPVPQRWALCGREVTFGGHTYVPYDVVLTGGVQSDTGTPGGLQISAPAVTEAQIAMAADPEIEGAEVVVVLALVDPATGVAEDALPAGNYELDMPGWEDGPEAMVHFAAESRAAIAMRPRVSRYTNDEQQRLHPGDTSLNFDPATDAAPLVWPSQDYFKVQE